MNNYVTTQQTGKGVKLAMAVFAPIWWISFFVVLFCIFGGVQPAAWALTGLAIGTVGYFGARIVKFWKYD